MLKQTITEIKKGQIGTGLLIENDGYISLKTKENKPIMEAIELGNESGKRNIPYPFVVSAVFQKYGIENANGRVYPETILKREVEKYQQVIKERRAYGECYTPDALCLTKNGWVPIIDIKEGDEILTLNVNTLKNEYQSVIRKIEHYVDNPLINVTSDYINDTLTPNHEYPLFIYKEGIYQFFAFKSIKEIKILTEEEKPFYIPISLDASKMEEIHNLSFEETEYNGKVYCVEVPNHTWFVKQNRKSHWTKNCNHPESSSIDLGRICMNIIELHWEGHTLVGKLELPISDGFRNYGFISSFADMVAQWLISGLKIGVSSRALGSVTQQLGKLVVGDDLELVCWDVVSQPSTPGAWMSPNENELQQYVEDEKKSGNLIKENKFSEFENWLNG